MRQTSYNESAERHEEETGWGMAIIGVIVALVIAYGIYAFYMSNQTQPIDYGAGTVVLNDNDQPMPTQAQNQNTTNQ